MAMNGDPNSWPGTVTTWGTGPYPIPNAGQSINIPMYPIISPSWTVEDNEIVVFVVAYYDYPTEDVRIDSVFTSQEDAEEYIAKRNKDADQDWYITELTLDAEVTFEEAKEV